MTLFGAAHKVFLAVLARSGTTHHPQDLRLRSALLLLVKIMNGLDHWRMTVMTLVGTTRKVFLAILARSGTTHHPQDLRLRSALLLLVKIMNGLDHWHSRHMMLMTWVGIAPPAKF